MTFLENFNAVRDWLNPDGEPEDGLDDAVAALGAMVAEYDAVRDVAKFGLAVCVDLQQARGGNVDADDVRGDDLDNDVAWMREVLEGR